MAKAKKQKKDFPIFTVFCIVIGVLLAIGITATVLENTGFSAKRKTIMTVGDESVNALEFNYVYQTAYNNYYSYLSYFGVDTSADNWVDEVADSSAASLLGITVSEGDTWKHVFATAASETLKTELSLYQLAKSDENYTIDYDSVNSSVDERIESDKATAESYGVDLKTLYSSSYGKGFTETVMRKMLEYAYIAEAYQTDYKENLTYDDSALEKYYSENKTTYDVYSFVAVDFAYETTDDDSAAETATESEEAKKAKADAEAYVEANKADKDSFVKGNEAAAEYTDKTYSEVSTAVGSSAQSWISDSERKAGDTTVIEGTNKYTALYFVESHRDEYKLANVRVIRLDAEIADSDSGATDEELAALKEKAESLYETYKKDPTEDNFKTIATENSADSNTASDGGLYEGLTKSTAKGYSSDLAAWVFSSERKAGDTEIFEGTEKYYIMYFVSQGEEYWKQSCETSLRSNDTSDWTEQCIEKFADTTSFDLSKAVENVG